MIINEMLTQECPFCHKTILRKYILDHFIDIHQLMKKSFFPDKNPHHYELWCTKCNQPLFFSKGILYSEVLAHQCFKKLLTDSKVQEKENKKGEDEIMTVRNNAHEIPDIKAEDEKAALNPIDINKDHQSIEAIKMATPDQLNDAVIDLAVSNIRYEKKLNTLETEYKTKINTLENDQLTYIEKTDGMIKKLQGQIRTLEDEVEKYRTESVSYKNAYDKRMLEERQKNKEKIELELEQQSIDEHKPPL